MQNGTCILNIKAIKQYWEGRGALSAVWGRATALPQHWPVLTQAGEHHPAGKAPRCEQEKHLNVTGLQVQQGWLCAPGYTPLNITSRSLLQIGCCLAHQVTLWACFNVVTLISKFFQLFDALT